MESRSAVYDVLRMLDDARRRQQKRQNTADRILNSPSMGDRRWQVNTAKYQQREAIRLAALIETLEEWLRKAGYDDEQEAARYAYGADGLDDTGGSVGQTRLAGRDS